MARARQCSPVPAATFHIHLCFLPHAQKAATEAKVPWPGERVLDLATGTGLVALDAAHRVGTQGSVLGVDLTAAMLAKSRPLLSSSFSGLQMRVSACIRRQAVCRLDLDFMRRSSLASLPSGAHPHSHLTARNFCKRKKR